MKRCSNCFQKKPLTEFYRKLASTQSRCKSCNAEVVRGYAVRRREREMAFRWAMLKGGARIVRETA